MKTAAVITLTDPYLSRHGGTLRTTGFIEALESGGRRVETLFPAAAIGATLRATPPDGLVGRAKVAAGNVKRHFLPMPTVFGGRDAMLSGKVRAVKADVVLVSVLSQARFAGLSAAPLWLDFMDLWSEFATREAANKEPVARVTASLQARYLRRLEARVAKSATVVTTAGWGDHLLLAERGVRNTWVPTALPDEEFRRVSDVHGGGLRVAGFLGNFDFWPNRDAAELLVREWLPRLRSQGWTLLIAGHGSSDLRGLPEDVVVLGQVNSLDDYYRRISATVAPIRLGGGMKVKVVESLARGIPVIGTNFAFDGFPPSMRKFFAEVDLLSPDLRDISALRPVDPDDPELDSYRQSNLNRAIEELARSFGGAPKGDAPMEGD